MQTLEELFTFVSPRQLRLSVTEVFFTWLIEQPVLPQNYKEIAQDVRFLLLLLEEEEARYNVALNTSNL